MPMSHEEIYAGLNGVFDDVFEYEGALGPGTTSDDVEGWDSIGHVRMILAAEMKFGVRFQPSEVTGFENLGDLVAAISAKLG